MASPLGVRHVSVAVIIVSAFFLWLLFYSEGTYDSIVSSLSLSSIRRINAAEPPPAQAMLSQEATTMIMTVATASALPAMEGNQQISTSIPQSTTTTHSIDEELNVVDIENQKKEETAAAALAEALKEKENDKLLALKNLKVGSLPSYSEISDFPFSRAPSEMFSERVDRIIFVKTHKTGSSTLASILRRYADTHKLSTFVPPVNGYGTTFSRHEEPDSVDMKRHFSLWAQHTYYDRTWLLDRVPSGVFISIVRDPVDRFVSDWYYFGRSRKRQKTIETFVNLEHSLWSNPRDRELSEKQAFRLDKIDYENSGLNGLSLELANGHISEVNRSIEDMKSGNLAHVLVLERLDESLLIMARLFKWSMEDIFYISQKTACSKHVEKRPFLFQPGPYSCWRAVSNETRLKLADLHALDARIYRAAVDELDRKIAAETVLDPTWPLRLKEFKERNEAFNMKCCTFLKDSNGLGGHVDRKLKVKDSTDCLFARMDNVDWANYHHHKKDPNNFKLVPKANGMQFRLVSEVTTPTRFSFKCDRR